MSTPDLLGHDRRIWSAAGIGPQGKHVQVEVMVWWLRPQGYDVPRRLHFARQARPARGGQAMLPAVCHKE
jgi:hypothetical protein